MNQGITVNYFSYSGKFYGQMASDNSKNIFLRFAQYELYHQQEKRLNIAQKIISNKISNQRYMISKHRWTDEPHDWKTDVERLKELESRLWSKETSNEIMGIEGLCSNIYFGAFGYFFDCDFQFFERNRRPPKDPINVLISLGYTFLTKDVSAALDAESFEMYLGILHGVRYGRKSLPLDIVEEFRQPVVDHFVNVMCNKRVFNKFDFEIGEEVTLTEDGFKKFCYEYEKWVTKSKGVNYRNVIKRQVAMLKRTILNGCDYIPYSMEAEHVYSEL